MTIVLQRLNNLAIGTIKTNFKDILIYKTSMCKTHSSQACNSLRERQGIVCGWNWGGRDSHIIIKENRLPFITFLFWVKIHLHWKAMKCFLYFFPVSGQQGGTAKTSFRILPLQVSATPQSNPRAVNTAAF